MRRLSGTSAAPAKPGLQRIARLPACSLVAALVIGCGKAPSGQGRAGVIGKLTYAVDVRPITGQFCRCHADNPSPPGKFSISDYQNLMKGGISGREVVPGLPDSSNLYRRVSRGEMPPTRKLADADIRVIRDWIAQGAKE